MFVSVCLCMAQYMHACVRVFVFANVGGRAICWLAFCGTNCMENDDNENDGDGETKTTTAPANSKCAFVLCRCGGLYFGDLLFSRFAPPPPPPTPRCCFFSVNSLAGCCWTASNSLCHTARRRGMASWWWDVEFVRALVSFQRTVKLIYWTLDARECVCFYSRRDQSQPLVVGTPLSV